MSLEIGELQGNLVDGQWVARSADETIPVANPSTLEVVGRVPDQDEAAALGGAVAAEQAAPGWAAIPAVEREAILLKAAELFDRHREDLARIINPFG